MRVPCVAFTGMTTHAGSSTSSAEAEAEEGVSKCEKRPFSSEQGLGLVAVWALSP